MSWSKITGSKLWEAARQAYAGNGGIYHGFEHPHDLYDYAGKLNVPYSLSLDRAILAHDVIINLGHGANEAASADWLDKALGCADVQARELIMTTAAHGPLHPDNTLALLDLYNLTDPVDRHAKAFLLYDEARLKAENQGEEFDGQKWLLGTLNYLKGVSISIQADLVDYGGPDALIWDRIAHGAAACAAVRGFNFGEVKCKNDTGLTDFQIAALIYLDARGVGKLHDLKEVLVEFYVPNAQTSHLLYAEIYDLHARGLLEAVGSHLASPNAEMPEHQVEAFLDDLILTCNKNTRATLEEVSHHYSDRTPDLPADLAPA